jgi:hypothetical protein
VADNIGGGDVQLAALEAKLDAGDSTFDSQLRNQTVPCTSSSSMDSQLSLTEDVHGTV